MDGGAYSLCAVSAMDVFITSIQLQDTSNIYRFCCRYAALCSCTRLPSMKHNMLQNHACSITGKETHGDTCLSISVSVASFADALFFLSTYESYNNFILDPFSYGRFLFLTSLYRTCSRFYTFSSIFISLDTFLFPSALFRTFL